MLSRKHVAIVDIDGVLANCEKRLHFIQEEPKNWQGFFDAMHEDTPIWQVCSLVRSLAKEYTVIYVTGRPASHRNDTQNWISKYKLPDGPVFMRRTGDHREDHVVKKEIFEQCIGDADFVIEDRDQVVNMWRSLGLLCLQPCRGNY